MSYVCTGHGIVFKVGLQTPAPFSYKGSIEMTCLVSKLLQSPSYWLQKTPGIQSVHRTNTPLPSILRMAQCHFETWRRSIVKSHTAPSPWPVQMLSWWITLMIVIHFLHASRQHTPNWDRFPCLVSFPNAEFNWVSYTPYGVDVVASISADFKYARH